MRQIGSSSSRSGSALRVLSAVGVVALALAFADAARADLQTVPSAPSVSTSRASVAAVSTPPATTPKVTTPPVATPPVKTPPVPTPPVKTPPVKTPPVKTPAVTAPKAAVPQPAPAVAATVQQVAQQTVATTAPAVAAVAKSTGTSATVAKAATVAKPAGPPPASASQTPAPAPTKSQPREKRAPLTATTRFAASMPSSAAAAETAPRVQPQHVSRHVSPVRVAHPRPATHRPTSAAWSNTIASDHFASRAPFVAPRTSFTDAVTGHARAQTPSLPLPSRAPAPSAPGGAASGGTSGSTFAGFVAIVAALLLASQLAARRLRPAPTFCRSECYFSPLERPG